jgi:choline dehydrogenase-like flavoprotein
VSEFDAIVVGAGATGGWVAKELCERGLSVLLLEAGPAVDSGDFPDPPPPRRPLADRARSALRGQAVQMRGAAFDARTARFFVNDRENPYSTPPGAPFNWFRGRQVGGRMHVWARVAWRLSEAELEGWPLTREELDPYYARAEEFMGVAEVPRTPAEEAFISRVREVRPAGPLAAARADALGTPATIRAAQATGLLTLRPDSVVRSVTVDAATGRATGVELADRRTRRAREERAGLVFLCASAFETLRLLLASRSARHPAGLGNSTGLLGRGVMDHVVTGVGGPDPRGGSPPGEPYSAAGATGFHVAADEHRFGLQGGVGRGPSWYMLAHGEMEARAQNRVTLDPRRTDAWGVPAARVECTHSPRDEAMAAQQLDLMRELAAAAGLSVRTPPSGRRRDALAFRVARRRLLTRAGAFVPGSAMHEVGGAPMGTDPASSVVDPFGRCWDAGNVVVADGAAFPSGCWRNTTLTLVALAIRAAERAAG